ncbi:MAG: prephenate dehydrogenase [Anaerolineae bacterium]|nr:prephenate dehydrogenase [Anaerolineae bacterium]
MDKQRITIIGAGCIGASIGIALRKSADAGHLEVVGHDRDLGTARNAQKLGAFDRTEFNLHLALAGAKLVILAVPLSALREVLADVGRLLDANAGVVVSDTAPLKAPVLQWADELLPPGNHFVGADPFLAPGVGGWEPLSTEGDARADLFARAVYAITARAEDHPSAVRAVTNLALVLGAEPLFMNPAEHDAARLIGDAVPGIVAAALFQATVEAPGWGEVRKAAGRAFATATSGAADMEPISQRMMALLGQETLLRGLDAFQERLSALRGLIAEGNAEALEQTLGNVSKARAYWMAESRERIWDIEQGSTHQDGLFRRTMQALVGEVVIRKPRDS